MESETIEDILKEMRRGTRLSGYWRSCDVNKILQYHADCIEAAYNRLNTKSPENVNSEKVIYNNAKMYEALMQIRDSVYIDPDDGKCQSDIDASDLREICDAALAEPPRNCDKFSKAEVLEILNDRSFSKEDTIEWLYTEAGGSYL